ncbi:MAG: Bacterial domain [Actinomycetota bacterium]|nr:Bacterial domain [Actinomycetota bacterium]
MVFYPRLRGLAHWLGLPLGIAFIAAAGVVYLRSVGLPAPEADIALALLLGVHAGLPLLLWSLLTVHRRRVVVDDDGVMVVNAFSSYRIPWDDLHGVELVRDRPVLRRQAGVDNLAFRTPAGSVIADVPRAWYEPGRERPLLAAVKTIEAARPHNGPAPRPEDSAGRPGLRVHGVDALLPHGCPDWILGGAFQLLMVTAAMMLGITFLVVMIYSP